MVNQARLRPALSALPCFLQCVRLNYILDTTQPGDALSVSCLPRTPRSLLLLYRGGVRVQPVHGRLPMLRYPYPSLLGYAVSTHQRSISYFELVPKELRS